MGGAGVEQRLAAEPATSFDPSAGLYPPKANMRYRGERPLTAEEEATTYNNFYVFGSQKGIWPAAQVLPSRPWTVTIDGMVEMPRTVAIDDLLAAMGKLGERVNRTVRAPSRACEGQPIEN